ncbi:unnamed protein product [marine sediment metagenome]|uniref:Uncharacterized protein n=1 Tax=marine sediment metagenome TaxID=412755 RepID=X0SY60_9ZZZZ
MARGPVSLIRIRTEAVETATMLMASASLGGKLGLSLNGIRIDLGWKYKT